MIANLVGRSKITNRDNSEEDGIWSRYSNAVRYADSLLLLLQCMLVYIDLSLAV